MLVLAIQIQNIFKCLCDCIIDYDRKGRLPGASDSSSFVATVAEKRAQTTRLEGETFVTVADFDCFSTAIPVASNIRLNSVLCLPPVRLNTAATINGLINIKAL